MSHMPQHELDKVRDEFYKNPKAFVKCREKQWIEKKEWLRKRNWWLKLLDALLGREWHSR